MAVKLAPVPRQQYLDSSGNPYAGAKLFYYAAGTTTKQTTYTTSAGDVANTNPIILDASGRTPYGVWLTAGASYKAVLAPSTDTDPPTSPIFTEDNITGVNDTSAGNTQWSASGAVPTYVSATQFTVPGDKTSTFLVNRRVKVSVTAGTLYGYISASAYTTLTTVTVVMDSGALDTGLTSVEVGILTDLNSSIPPTVAKKTTANTFTQVQTLSGVSIVEANGTVAANATTSAIWLAGNYVTLTGSATVFTDFADAPQAGAEVEIYCNDAHTFTNNANLIVDGATNFVAAAGDRVIVRAKSTSVFTVRPIKANGRAVVDSSLTQISRVTTQVNVTSNTSVADVSALTASLVSGQTYEFVANLHVNNVIGGHKIAMGGTCSASSYIHAANFFLTPTSSTTFQVMTKGNASGDSSACTFIQVIGTIACSSSGTLVVQFAQNASDPGASSILVGSTFKVTNIT